jgi:mRNA-degrading endonuclease RelE of RelBE toxin-antitoxin system
MTKINEIIQSPLFAKQKKKLHKNQIEVLDNAIFQIMNNPEMGQLKVGDLSGIRIHKFRAMKEQILLAYEIADNNLYLYAFGTHENFYRQLKKYLKH